MMETTTTMIRIKKMTSMNRMIMNMLIMKMRMMMMTIVVNTLMRFPGLLVVMRRGETFISPH